MERDIPSIVAEVTAAFEAYEEALVASDADRILSFFTEDAVRFGIADEQAGLAEQAAWRRAQPALPPDRRLKDQTVRGYGPAAQITRSVRPRRVSESTSGSVRRPG